MVVLVLIPVFVSAIFGTVFLVLSPARPFWKGTVIVVFAVATYLQFFSRHSLAGLLLQIALAVALLLEQRLDTGR